MGTGYALWRHNTEVVFNLTISEPEQGDGCCVCGMYDTVQEGIDLLRDVQYPKVYNRLDAFKNQIEARIIELEALPYGGITFDELSQERNQYMADIAEFRECVRTYGQCCINTLTAIYNSLTWQEKSQIPDFWTQHSNLWDLSDQLWYKLDELYDVVDEFWEVGESKIDYNNSANKGKKGK